MSSTTTSLGGRLPLAERTALAGAQLELFDRFTAESVPWAQRAGFVMRSADGALIGPFNPLLESPESAFFWWDYQAAEERHTTLYGREDGRVVILAAVRNLACPLQLYSHSAAARTAKYCHRAGRHPGGRRDAPISSRPASSAHGGSRASSRLSGTSSNHSTTKRRNCSEPTGSSTCST